MMPALQIRTRPPAHRPAILRRPLRGRRLALLAHPASVSADLRHALDALAAARSAAYRSLRPQHGLRGDKQDNMVESPEFLDPLHHIPVFSLYGAVRRPTPAMMATFDVLLIDLQDLGCRIYTFITTCATCSKPLPSTARRCGSSIAPTRQDVRWRDCCCVPAGRASSAPGHCRCGTV
jgi:hypothetical protein